MPATENAGVGQSALDCTAGKTSKPSNLKGRKMSTCQSAVTLCNWGVKAGMVHSTCG